MLGDRALLDGLIGTDYSLDVPIGYNTDLLDRVMCYYYNELNDADIAPGKLEAGKYAIHDAFERSGLKRSDFSRYSQIPRNVLSDSLFFYPSREMFDYMDERLHFSFEYDDYKPGWQETRGAILFSCPIALERYRRVQNFVNDVFNNDVSFSSKEYDEVDLSEADFVYCDPPYRSTLNVYGSDFDYSRFVKWLGDIDTPAFVSEYNAPSDDFVSIASFANRSILGNNGSKIKPPEQVFLRRDFVPWYRDVMKARGVDINPID